MVKVNVVTEPCPMGLRIEFTGHSVKDIFQGISKCKFQHIALSIAEKNTLKVSRQVAHGERASYPDMGSLRSFSLQKSVVSFESDNLLSHNEY